jgi:hypothetical protein
MGRTLYLNITTGHQGSGTIHQTRVALFTTIFYRSLPVGFPVPNTWPGLSKRAEKLWFMPDVAHRKHP